MTTHAWDYTVSLDFVKTVKINLVSYKNTVKFVWTLLEITSVHQPQPPGSNRAPSEIFSIIPSQQFDNHSIESSNDPLGTIQSPLETQDIRTSGRILSMYYEYIIEQILPSSRIYFSVIYDRFI